MTAEELVPEIQQPPARYTGSLVESAATVATLLEPGDLFFTMGAGTVNSVGPIVLEALKQR